MAYIGNSPGVASQRIVTTFTATAGQTTFTPSSGYTVGYLDVYHNGVKLINGDDYTASNGSTFALASGAASGDVIEAVAYLPRGLSDGYTQAEADARYMDINAVTLPSQTGNNGKYLTTDGSDASWGTVDLSTKVSKTGDTMTGALAVPAGSTVGGTPDFTNYSLEVNATSAAQLILHKQADGLGASTNLAMQITQTNGQSARLAEISSDFISNWGGSLKFGVKPANGSPNNSTNNCMTIDSSGRVTMPYQPHFYIHNTSQTGQTPANEQTVLHYNVVRRNTGNHYNSSTRAFTAPVSGVYAITATARFDGCTSYSRLSIAINGQVSSAHWTPGAHSISESGGMRSHSVSCMLYLSANDYIQAIGGTNNGSGSHQGEGHFSAILLG
jgi:hypothetical protein